MPVDSRKKTARKTSASVFAPKRPIPLAVKELRRDLGLSRKQFARLAGASERSVAEWEDDKPISSVSKKSLTEAHRLFEALKKIMKPEFIGEWLDSPNDAFFGLKPLDLIERGEADRLWRMIFEVESGALR